MIYLAFLVLLNVAIGVVNFTNISHARAFLNTGINKNRFLVFVLKDSISYEPLRDSLLVSESSSDSIFGLIEISEEDKEQIKSEFSINSLPHIVCSLKDHTDYFTYLGSIDPEEIQTTLRRMANPIPEYYNYNQLKDDESIEGLALGVFSTSEIKYKDVFIRLAVSGKQFYRFAYTSSQEIAEHFNIKDGVVLLRPKVFSDEVYKIENIDNIEILEGKIYKNHFGRILWLNPFTEGLLFEGKPSITLFIHISPIKDSSKFNGMVKALLNIDSEKYKIAIARYADYSWLLAKYGYNKNNLPILAINNSTHLFISEKEDLEYNNELSTSMVETVIENFEKENMFPSLKSELPQPDDNGIINYVGTSLIKAINEPTNEFLLLVFSDDCNSCENAKTFIKKLKNNEDIKIKIGQINASKNGLPQAINLSEVPSFFFIKDSKIAEIKYETGLSASVVINFIDSPKQDL